MTEHIETARESEAKREPAWEKNRKEVSPNMNKATHLVDHTGVTTGTREDQHEMSDDFGQDNSPETPINPATLAAEDQSEGRTHSKGVTDLAKGAVSDRMIDHAAKTTLGRHVKSAVDGVAERAARSKHVKSKRAESEKVFGK